MTLRSRPRWSPMAFLRSFTSTPKDAGEVALRWTRAFRAEPELASDLVRIGGVASTIPARFVDGVEQADPIDPLRLAYEAGRRDLALKLLAAGNIGQYQLNQLLEPDND